MCFWNLPLTCLFQFTMSKRPGFDYDGSKIVIVPTVSFCGPPAKTPKLSTETSPWPVPKVISNIHITPQKAQINQSHNYNAGEQKCQIPIVQQKVLASDVTSKKSSNVSQAINENYNSQKDISKVNTKAEASCSSWASNYLSSIGHIFKKPNKVSL